VKPAFSLEMGKALSFLIYVRAAVHVWDKSYVKKEHRRGERNRKCSMEKRKKPNLRYEKGEGKGGKTVRESTNHVGNRRLKW